MDLKRALRSLRILDIPRFWADHMDLAWILWIPGSRAGSVELGRTLRALRILGIPGPRFDPVDLGRILWTPVDPR